MKTLIKNGKIIKKANQLIPVSLWLEQGVIKAIGQHFDESNFDHIYDAKGQLITPGLVDIHVHLREPGFTEKETIATGSKAAAHGGFTTICAMPNVRPVIDNDEKLTANYQRIKNKAQIKVWQYAAITEQLNSDRVTNIQALKKAGAIALTNDGCGVQSAATMYFAMKAAAENNIILAAHSEDESLLFGGVLHQGEAAQRLALPGILSASEASQIARDLILAGETGVHYHVCHVSCKESVRLIREAKRIGIHVTAEVTPHHLILTEDVITENNALWKMNPPLRTKEDRDALIEGLLDGTIDCIATDHAPHTLTEKQQGFLAAPFGIVGSETAFQLIYTHFVITGRFTLEQVIHWMATKPAELFSLNAGTIAIGSPADIAIFDLTNEEYIDEHQFESKSTNSPFIGWRVKGNTMMTFVDGKLVWSKEEQSQ